MVYLVSNSNVKGGGGVRQGNPLSPLLFVLAAELLQYIFNDAFSNGSLSIPAPQFATNFPVIQYADDTLLIMKADATELLHLKNLLGKFVTSTGLQVNFHKPMILPINVPMTRCNIWLQSWDAKWVPCHSPIWACQWEQPSQNLLIFCP